MTEQQTVVPPMLYIPLRVSADGTQGAVEIQELADGRKALLTYTALDRLLDLAGENQP